MATIKRVRTSIQERERILQKYDQFPPMPQRAAARLLNISPSLLCVWLRNRRIRKDNVKLTNGASKTNKTQLLEAALWRWIDNLQEKGITKNELIVRSKATMLARAMNFRTFRSTKDWYKRFKIRERAIRKLFLVRPEGGGSQNNPSDENRNDTALQDPENSREDCTLIGEKNSQADCTLIGEKNNAAEQNADESDNDYVEIFEQSENESQPKHILVIKQSDDVSVEENSDPITEMNIPKLEPTVITAEVNGDSHSVTVPSLWQMKEAMKTLSTGLLYRGFCDFKLLHQFEKEVDNVVRRSWSLRTQSALQP